MEDLGIQTHGLLGGHHVGLLGHLHGLNLGVAVGRHFGGVEVEDKLRWCVRWWNAKKMLLSCV